MAGAHVGRCAVVMVHNLSVSLQNVQRLYKKARCACHKLLNTARCEKPGKQDCRSYAAGCLHEQNTCVIVSLAHINQGIWVQRRGQRGSMLLRECATCGHFELVLIEACQKPFANRTHPREASCECLAEG